MTTRVLAGMLCLVSAVAQARDPEGRLDLVLGPNSTQPAIVAPGNAFDVVLRENAALRLESAAGSFALPAAEPGMQRGRRVARVTLPAEVPAGTYTLVAASAGHEDRNYRSVVVLEAPLESYRVAVWSNLRVGADPQHPDTELFRVSARINAEAADLVLVTGDLTATGTPEQFRLALDILNDCIAPTLVAPGAIDFASGRVQEFLGAYPAAVPFGPDALLLGAASAGDLGAEAGRLHLERRRIRAARWSIGVMPGFDLARLREQLIVLVDDPLDAVLGVPEEAGPEPGDASLWGRGRVYTVPPDRGALEWYAVTPQRVSLLRER